MRRRWFLSAAAALVATPRVAAASSWDVPRVFVGWEPRAEDRDACARRIHAAFRALALTSDAPWTTVDPASAADHASPEVWKNVPCDDVDAIATALAWGGYPLDRAPAQAPEFFKQYFYLGTFRDFRAKVTCCCGVSSARYGTSLPNGFDLVLGRDSPDEDLQKMLVSLVRVFDPVCGLVAAEGAPPRPVDWDGTPAVGSLTWLSRWFGKPPDLSPPIRTRHLRGGTLIEAFAGHYDPLDATRRAMLRDLDAELRADGFLRAYAPV